VARAILIVLDSVGCGAAADAHLYGDTGADTVRGGGGRPFPGAAQDGLDVFALAREAIEG